MGTFSSKITMFKLKLFASFAFLSFGSSLRLPIKENVRNSAKDSEPGPRLQLADCYAYTQGQGASLHVSDYIPILRNYGWDNLISSCCFTGIWILYGEENYNRATANGAVWWAFGINNCIDVPNQFSNIASSIRFTGAPDDYLYDTLNLYFEEYFSGDEEFMYTNMPLLNYDNRAKSLVVTRGLFINMTIMAGCLCVSSLVAPPNALRAITKHLKHLDLWQARFQVHKRDALLRRRCFLLITVLRWKAMEHQVSLFLNYK